jgi:hypothetical protein
MDTALNFVGSVLGFVPAVAFGATLIAFLVDTAKRLGLPDGSAPALSGALNLALYALVFFATDAQKATIQDAVTAINLVAPYVTALFFSLLATAKAHHTLAPTGIGYSHSAALG